MLGEAVCDEEEEEDAVELLEPDAELVRVDNAVKEPVAEAHPEADAEAVLLPEDDEEPDDMEERVPEAVPVDTPVALATDEPLTVAQVVVELLALAELVAVPVPLPVRVGNAVDEALLVLVAVA